ncbi:MAG: FAD-dependent oxidoreductase [Candidatus Omnitrophica bacterium]|nr:FAD-dependent oxidoreductase [Candidatus Omnitrophota bacterium]
MANKRIIIIGAGLTGLSLAWHLQKRKISCSVFEKEPEVGGLCRSKQLKGFIFDHDGHLLHFRHRYAFDLVGQFLGDNLVEHKRSAWIYSYGRFTRYPFQANLYGLPFGIVKECLATFVKAQSSGYVKKNGNFAHWINAVFGKGIARHFMVPYNRKFWTVPPAELTCDWLDGIIPVPTLAQVIEGTVEESKRQFGYNARFWYPKIGGINQLPQAIAKGIGNIHMNQSVKKIDLKKKEIWFSCGRREKFDFLISTAPLPELSRLIDGLPKRMAIEFSRLRWNSIFNLNLGIEKREDAGWHWVYFPQKESCFFRVGFAHNFSTSIAPEGKRLLYAEVSYSKEKPIDKLRIISAIIRDLKKTGILDSNDKICAQDVNDISYGYPIYDRNYRLARQRIMDFLGVNNVISCGRYGGWRYMSMEDCLMEGKELAERLSS